MIKIKPTPKELQQSFDFMIAYKEGDFGKNVLGVSTEEFFEFIRIGKLCEIVLINHLIQNKIKITAKELLIPCPDKHRKGPDFIIAHSNQEVDVKAANKSFHKRLLIRDDQFKAHIHDIYIGAKYIDDSGIEFWGYILGQDLKNTNSINFGHGTCKNILLSDLKPIELFIEKCKKGETIN